MQRDADTAGRFGGQMAAPRGGGHLPGHSQPVPRRQGPVPRTAAASRVAAGRLLPLWGSPPLLTPGTPLSLVARASRARAARQMLGMLLPRGARPCDLRHGRPGQNGQIRVIEGFDVRVRAGTPHADDGPTIADGYDALHRIGFGGLLSLGAVGSPGDSLDGQAPERGSANPKRDWTPLPGCALGPHLHLVLCVGPQVDEPHMRLGESRIQRSMR